MAALAPAVIACAESGDPPALAILHAAVEQLVASVHAAVSRCALPDAFQLVLSGEVF